MLAEKELGRGLPFGMYVPLYTLSVVVICGSFVKAKRPSCGLQYNCLQEGKIRSVTRVRKVVSAHDTVNFFLCFLLYVWAQHYC